MVFSVLQHEAVRSSTLVGYWCKMSAFIDNIPTVDMKLITWVYTFLQKANGPILEKKSIFWFSVEREWKPLINFINHWQFMNISTGKVYRHWMVFAFWFWWANFVFTFSNKYPQRTTSYHSLSMLVYNTVFWIVLWCCILHHQFSLSITTQLDMFSQ